jgi:uncharacterized protein (TIGR03085 family)
MTRTNVAARLRHDLSDLFDAVGPDAPTLCEGWTTRDLAAHLVVRESRPDAAAGILVKAAASYGDRVRRRVADRPWPELVDDVRSGPPRLSPMRLRSLDDLTNTIEFFVHLEDVRRARPDGGDVTLDPVVDAALVRLLKRGARLLARRSPVGLVLAIAGHEEVVAKKGQPSVTVSGSPGDIVLFLYGRSSVADVAFDGPADAVEQLKATKFGV